MDKAARIKTDRVVRIKTYPTIEGDTVVETKLSALTPEKVFHRPFMVAVEGVLIHDWDELLEACERAPEPVEITRFKPVAGG